MRFVNPLPFVRDIGISRDFYRDIIGLQVLHDHGNFVQFATGFALHDERSLLASIFGQDTVRDLPYGRDNMVLYFETDDLDAAFACIAPQVVLLHAIEIQTWGQRVFRFRDPDGHLVELGEPESSGS